MPNFINPSFLDAFFSRPAEYFQVSGNIVDFILSLVLLLLVTLFISLHVQRTWVWIIYTLLDVLFVFSCLFSLPILQIVSVCLVVGASALFLFTNSGILRKYVAKPLKASKAVSTDKKDFDKEKLIQNVCTAVEWLSANKVGALITFERETPLDDFMKNGTIINCPFTPEIVETIFYEGTRLHDGAIIVKGDMIVAAAVYYQPSTKAMVGKFGARHRAALGISEITDSITVVVSEETGRISIAHAGIMDNVKTDEFEKIFRTQIM